MSMNNELNTFDEYCIIYFQIVNYLKKRAIKSSSYSPSTVRQFIIKFVFYSSHHFNLTINRGCNFYLLVYPHSLFKVIVNYRCRIKKKKKISRKFNETFYC